MGEIDVWIEIDQRYGTYYVYTLLSHYHQRRTEKKVEHKRRKDKIENTHIKIVIQEEENPPAAPAHTKLLLGSIWWFSFSFVDAVDNVIVDDDDCDVITMMKQ